MKSLAELHAEKSALLEKMRMQRNLTRSIATTAAANLAQKKNEFPRSHTFRILKDQPVLVAIGVLAVGAIGPRKVLRLAVDSVGKVSAGMEKGSEVALQLSHSLPVLMQWLQSR